MQYLNGAFSSCSVVCMNTVFKVKRKVCVLISNVMEAPWAAGLTVIISINRYLLI